jgi:phospholipase C
VKRRDVLKSFGALAGARLLGGCGGGGGGGDGPPGIRNVVLLMQENRSYDHWLGARTLIEGKPGDGLVAGMANKDAAGTSVPIYPMDVAEYCVPDPPHGWDLSHTQFNAGANDGFVIAQQMEHPGNTQVMQYMQRADLPVTYALADQYAICDRWFCSVMGPTWPNRMYWLSGTSMGMMDNEIPAAGYTTPTIFHRLADAGVDFRVYYGDVPFVPLLGGAVDAVLDGKLQRMTQFFADAQAGALPPVSYVDPPFTYGDDHPPHDPPYGQAVIASVYNALAASPQWNHTLLIVTYDEHGGFFDHVPPPKMPDDRATDGFDQVGFRVPTLVIGPYVKQSYVSSVVRDHTSALKHLEGMFGTQPLTARSSAATDLSELLDMDRLASGQPAAPIEIPAVTADINMIPASCMDNNGLRTVDPHPVLAAADANLERMARYDARADLPALWREIAKWARKS